MAAKKAQGNFSSSHGVQKEEFEHVLKLQCYIGWLDIQKWPQGPQVAQRLCMVSIMREGLYIQKYLREKWSFVSIMMGLRFSITLTGRYKIEKTENQYSRQCSSKTYCICILSRMVLVSPWWRFNNRIQHKLFLT